jgi:Bacterial TSP3 repeat
MAKGRCDVKKDERFSSKSSATKTPGTSRKITGEKSKVFFLMLIAALFITQTSRAGTDGDGMPDAWENMHDCLLVDTIDSGNDPDGDGMTSLEEYLYSEQMDPCSEDTDGDGAFDGDEVLSGSNPLSSLIVPNISHQEYRVTNDPSNSSSLVFTGSEYGLFWGDYRNENLERYFSRFSSSGIKLTDDIRITYSEVTYHNSVVFTGSEYGLSYILEKDGVREAYFNRISLSGVKIGNDTRISFADDSLCTGICAAWPSLVYTGSEYGFSWSAMSDSGVGIYFTRISNSGIKIEDNIFVALVSYPSLVSAGSEFGVAWCNRYNEEKGIHFSRISSKNEIGSDTRITYGGLDCSCYPSLAFAGPEYGVSWQNHSSKIYFNRISSSGEKIGSYTSIASPDLGSSHSTSLVFTGTEYGVSFSDHRDGYDEIYFNRISRSG